MSNGYDAAKEFASLKLLDEIVAGAVDGHQPIADVLRKCLVLAFKLKNDRLKEWVEKELNGYGLEDIVPQYRSVLLHSKGNFQGYGGAWLPQRPLPLGILSKQHQALMKGAKFRDPIASFESGVRSAEKDRKKLSPVRNWSPDLIAMYQDKFIDGYALVQAWQEIPPGVIVSLVDSVRNRVLGFALELQGELGAVSDKVEELPKAKVEQAVTNIIFGGTNIIGGVVQDVSQIGNISIQVGNFAALVAALKSIGVGEADVAALKSAIKKIKRHRRAWAPKLRLGSKGLAARDPRSPWTLEKN
jgi:hypothetical protein